MWLEKHSTAGVTWMGHACWLRSREAEKANAIPAVSRLRDLGYSKFWNDFVCSWKVYYGLLDNNKCNRKIGGVHFAMFPFPKTFLMDFSNLLLDESRKNGISNGPGKLGSIDQAQVLDWWKHFGTKKLVVQDIHLRFSWLLILRLSIQSLIIL